jgi:hypothetical protein
MRCQNCRKEKDVKRSRYSGMKLCRECERQEEVILARKYRR